MNLLRWGRHTAFGIMVCGLALAAVRDARASNFYVALTGSDKNPGTLTLPWRTVQKACSAAVPGSVVQIRAGRYHEKVQVNVSGSAAGGWITIQNYPNEAVILDGAGLRATGEINSIGSDNILLIQDKAYIRISGLEIVNNTTVGTDGSGIRIYGGGDHLQITNCTIHHLLGPDDMGITVYGTEAARPVSNLLLANNTIYDATPAHSETLTLNGNVSTFEVVGNVIHNVNNIGIDCIGGERVCSDPTQDAARFGHIHHNRVSYVHSSYDGAAAALYVDGGHDIEIDHNSAAFSDEGIEIGAEHKGITARNIAVHDNLVYRNTAVGIVFGGYSSNAPGGVQTGSVDHLQFRNNTCYQNDTANNGNGELQVQYRATNITLENNVFVATLQDALISWDPSNTSVSGIHSDYNLFQCPDGSASAQFVWQNRIYGSFAAYRTGSSQDIHSIFAEPGFRSAANYDFHLQLTSAAINAGDPAFIPPSGSTDYYGNPRLLGGRIDIGADEAK